MSGPDRFECAVVYWQREACREERFYREHGGKQYSVLHCPTDDKGEAFAAAVGRNEQQDWNFTAVWFPDVTDAFRGREVMTEANFTDATFRHDVDFTEAKFQGGSRFVGTRFRERATFDRTHFNDTVSFNNVRFAQGASFRGAQFGAVGFYEAEFSGALDFHYAHFYKGLTFRNPRSPSKQDSNALNFFRAEINGEVEFSGQDNNTPLLGKLDLWDAIIGTPESVTFKKCRLKAEWLVTVDSSRFRFVDVRWDIAPIREALKEGIYIKELI
jgi:uncharacterized protein YjbI with pentapeptide repeats